MSGARLFATLFGIGRVPFAPGTAASLAAALLAWPIAMAFGHWVLLALAVAAGIAAIPIAEAYAKECGRDDPSECVIDELAGQWLACALAPVTPLGFVLAFLFFRILDMTKTWPISELEKLKGGLGIVADDMGAGLAAGLIVMLFAHGGYI